MRAVIDTNVFVSALLTPGGVPSRLVKAIRDTKIVPVVSHEILAEYARFPVRADDRLEADLHIDDEYLDYLAELVAERTGRPLSNSEQNPLFGKVTTVREFVKFFVHQHRSTAATAINRIPQ